jgi:Aspartyl protease
MNLDQSFKVHLALPKKIDIFLKFISAVIVLLILSFPGELLAQELYRWLDDKKIIHFSDNLHSIPEKYRRDAERRFFAPSPPAPAPISEDNLRRSTEPTPSPPSVPFFQISRGILVDGFVNQRGPVQLIVDQEAMITTLPAFMAAQLGITLKNSLPLRLEGIRGLSSGHLVTIDSLRLGDVEMNDFEVAISESVSSANGFLGRDFLGLFRVHTDFKLRRMELMPGDGLYDGLSPEWWQEKFRFYRSLKQTYEKNIKQCNESINKLQQLGSFEYGGNFAAALEEIRNEIRRYQGYVSLVTQKIDDLDRRASHASIPRELRE